MLMKPTNIRSYAVLLFSLGAITHSSAGLVYSEDFEGLPLGPNVDEGLPGANVWTKSPPPGWSQDDSAVPPGGVTEWKGWSFANKDWWVAAVGDQQRSLFTRGSGTVMIADPDEYDDIGGINGPPWYDTFISTSSIAIAGLAPNSLTLAFDSSWRAECCDEGDLSNSQTATIAASYDGGPFAEILRWDSTPGSPFFKDDAENEAVSLALANPAGASSLVLKFGLTQSGNEWWWAVDNIQLHDASTPVPDAGSTRAFLGLAVLGLALGRQALARS